MAGVTAELELQARQALAAIDQVEQALLRAVSVTVDLQTTGIAAQVDEALAAADATVDVDADIGPSVRQAATAVEDIGEHAEVAGRRVGELEGMFKKAALAAGGILIGREALQFGLDAVEVASNLNEQVSASEVIFRSVSDEVTAFGETSAQTMGLAEDQFLELANSVGGLAVGLGVSREEAARLGPELIQRAADVRSLLNVQGGTTAVVEAFTSALVGEGEAVRRFGVDISEASVQAKALELGLGGATRELTEAEKVQARYALILEGTSIAQGNLALTADQAANATLIATAEWREARGEIGEQLIPTMTELLGIAREELIPTLRDLGERAAPIVGEAFRLAGPAIDTAITALEGLTPVAGLVLDILTLLPPEVVSTGASFLGLSRILRIVGPSASAASGSLLGLHPAVAGIALGLTALTTVLGENARAAREERARIDELATAFLNLDESMKIDVETKAQEQFGDLVGTLREAGLTWEEVGKAARAGGDEWGSAVALVRRASGEMTVDAHVAESRLEGYHDELQRGAELAIDKAIAEGKLSEAQVATAESASEAAVGEGNYLDVLDRLLPIIRKGSDATGELTTAETLAADAAKQLAGDTEEAEMSLRDISIVVGEHKGALEGLPLLYLAAGEGADRIVARLAEGGLSWKEYAGIVADTGVSLEDILTIEDEVNAAIVAQVDTFTAQIPRIASAFDQLPADGPHGLDEFLNAAEQQLWDHERFLDNIAVLIERGADDLARAMLEAGPETAGAAAREAANIDAETLADKERHFEGLQTRENLRLIQVDTFGRQLVEIQGRNLEDIAGQPVVAAEQMGTQIDAALAGTRALSEDAGREISGGVAAGIRDNIASAVNAAVDLGRSVGAAIAKELEAESPSKVMERLGRDAVAGLALGLSQTGPVDTAARVLALAAVPSTAVAPAFSTRPLAAVGAMGGGVAAAATTAVGAVTTIQVGPNTNVDLDPLLVSKAIAAEVG